MYQWSGKSSLQVTKKGNLAFWLHSTVEMQLYVHKQGIREEYTTESRGVEKIYDDT